MRLILSVLPLIIALSACAEFPALDGTVSPAQANAPVPDLIPLASLIQLANVDGSTSTVVEAAIGARIASLQARASRLRGPVIPASTRTRMLRGVQARAQ
jgi:hypothetical protein